MKFNTQHIRVTSGHDNYQLHRDGKTTWKTTGNALAAFDVVVHTSVSSAKKLLGSITSVSK